MIISTKKLIALSLVAGFVTGAIPASAFTRIVKGSEGLGRASVNELANEDVAILPGNPFHPIIGILSGIRGFFISDSVREVSFKLEIAGRRAGEVRKLLDWASDNEELVSVSLVHYKNSLFDFSSKLRSLKESDLSEDAQEVLNDMTNRLLTQIRFVDDVRDSLVSSADQATLLSIDEILVGALEFIGTNLDNPNAFASRIANLVIHRADAATTIRTAILLKRLAVDIQASELASEMVEARAILVADLAKALNALDMTLVAANPAIGLMKVAAPEPAETTPTLADIIDQLADDELKVEIASAQSVL